MEVPQPEPAQAPEPPSEPQMPEPDAPREEPIDPPATPGPSIEEVERSSTG
jgi:hypothetical protein